MNSKVAVVGTSESILAYKAAGCDAFSCDEENVLSVLKGVLKEYNVILLIDTFLEKCGDVIKNATRSSYPVILPIPSSVGSSGQAMKELKSIGEKALGVDILKF